MIGYKGFNSELKCIGYQYEIGKTFEIDNNKKLYICHCGLHFCENPLDVLKYYPNEKGNRYAVVESIGNTIFDSYDSKVATDKLKVIKEITYNELVQLGVEYSIEKYRVISDKQFELCSETLKEKYVLMCIENNCYISDKMFEWCSETLKKEYVLMVVELLYLLKLLTALH